MNEPVTPPPDVNPSLGYEPRDVRVGWILVFAAMLAAMVVLVLPLTDWIFDTFEQSAEQRDVPASPLAAGQQPPEPRLQSQPSASLAALRRREDEALTKYRWLDREQKIVQLPVDRAIELLLERGLPEPKPTKNEPPSEGSKTPKNGVNAKEEGKR
jgi:hypothetical protein